MVMSQVILSHGLPLWRTLLTFLHLHDGKTASNHILPSILLYFSTFSVCMPLQAESCHMPFQIAGLVRNIKMPWKMLALRPTPCKKDLQQNGLIRERIWLYESCVKVWKRVMTRLWHQAASRNQTLVRASTILFIWFLVFSFNITQKLDTKGERVSWIKWAKAGTLALLFNSWWIRTDTAKLFWRAGGARQARRPLTALL